MKVIFEGVNDQEMMSKIKEYHDKAVAKFKENGGVWPEEVKGEEPAPVRVKLNSRMRSCGGRAKGMFYIDINYRLYLDNPEELENTYVHELAHIFCQRKYSFKVGHAREWKMAMTMMGQEPSRCHNLKVDHLRNSRKSFEYSCGCERYTHRLGPKRNQKALSRLVSSGSTGYSCRDCKKPLLPRKLAAHLDETKQLLNI